MNKFLSLKPYPFFLILIITAAGLLFSGCASKARIPEEPAVAEKPAAVQTEEKPEPVNIDWSGTGWILKDEIQPSDFPGYRGFYLASDGSLLLINFNNDLGGTWQAHDNKLVLSLIKDSGDNRLNGSFLVFACESSDQGETESLRLVPADTPDSNGFIINKRKINMDLMENLWNPKWILNGETVHWPMSKEIHMILLPDMEGKPEILGYGGENRFHAKVKVDNEFFIPGPIAATRKSGPADKFEHLYLTMLSEADRYVQVQDDLYLYKDTRPLIAFRVKLFD
jgi:heat shock protein HslJ